MFRTFKAAALAAALATAGALPLAAHAQQAERLYDQGPVWQISYVETKPDMFDDYMAYLSTTWRKANELQKKRGDVLDYRVLAVDAPRDQEPDVILMIEFKNMAAFDRSLDDLDKDNVALFGSTPKANQAAVSRESMRVLRGGMNTREITFRK